MLLLVPKIDRGSVSERKCNVLQQDPHIIVGQLMPGQLLFPPTLDATETASTVVPLQAELVDWERATMAIEQ